MKPINKEEIYEHLSSFLKSKGIELKNGSYSHRIQQGCNLLADSINLSQKGLTRAKVEIEKNVERVRQVIHEKTAPKPPPVKSKPSNASAGSKSGTAKKASSQKKRRSPKSR